jgi:hypothetical protein
MTPFRFAAALLLALAPLAGTAYAADPEFKVALVTESRTYEREETVTVSPPISGMPVFTKVSISRVTVALEGVHITAEWKNLGTRARAADFPLDSDVEAATRSNQLLLKHPNGSVVEARIVRRVKPEGDDDEEKRG